MSSSKSFRTSLLFAFNVVDQPFRLRLPHVYLTASTSPKRVTNYEVMQLDNYMRSVVRRFIYDTINGVIALHEVVISILLEAHASRSILMLLLIDCVIFEAQAQSCDLNSVFFVDCIPKK